MSLDYNLTKIKNHKKVCWLPIEEAGETPRIFLSINVDDDGKEYFMNPKTHNIIFRCMPVGIGVVSERTLPEFWARSVVWCALNKFPQDFTLNDLREHIGLSTNVFPEESRTKWVKRIVGGRLDDLRNEAQRTIAKELNI